MIVADAALEEVRQSPKLKAYVDSLRETLRREEEERRRFRASLRDGVRAEFINGRVVIQMSSRLSHTQAVRNIGSLLHAHVHTRRLGLVLTEQALVPFPRNDYCPDVNFWMAAKSRHFATDQLTFPVPDFVCEVLSPSTAAVDRGIKLQDYEANGVGEYWMADPDPRRIEQWVLGRDGRYERIGRFSRGIVRSHVVKGFEMPVRAAFNDADNLAVLKRLLGA
jgi:Uma2 family endonuclease